MKPRLLVPFVVLALVVVPGVAFAQSVVPVTALTPYSVLVTLLTLAVGVLTTVKNTGAVGGQPIPAKVMVWLTMVLPFVAGVTTTFVQAGALSAVSAFNAIVAGLVAVTAGATPGLVVHAALHAHLQVPKLVRAMRGNTVASAVKVAALVLFAGFLFGSQTSCKALTTVENVAQVVIADFNAGKPPAQIDADACAALGGSSLDDLICKDVSTVVIDIIDAAILDGTLRGDALARAQSYKASHAPALKAPPQAVSP